MAYRRLSMGTSGMNAPQNGHSCLCGSQDALPDGTTLLGIVLSSDKTHITPVGNCQAHLLLISLANISADICKKGSMNLFLLLALLPVLKFTHPNTHL